VENDHLLPQGDLAVDVYQIEGLAHDLINDSWPHVDADVREVLERLSGDLLPSWNEDWILLERERLRQVRLHALESICRHLTLAERFADAAAAGIAAVAAEPLRESAHRALVAAYLAEGNHAEALRQYRAFRELLAAELNLPPSPLMEQLIAKIRTRETGAG
jgi:DNA-binding SARP family transcriptional activator